MLVDKSLGSNQEIFFNPARHDVSIRMLYTDYIKLAKPEIVALVL